MIVSPRSESVSFDDPARFIATIEPIEGPGKKKKKKKKNRIAPFTGKPKRPTGVEGENR